MRRRGYRQLVEGDLDIMPLMNLFVVLIPMLLLSAVFVEINAIDMDLPTSADAAPSSQGEPLDLAIRLEPQRYVVEGRRLPTRTVERGDPEAVSELRALLASIREANPEERAVRIESPDHTRYQDLVRVMDVARSTGLDAIALARHPAAGSLREAR
jgi:biopolymer transport protein ExbD